MTLPAYFKTSVLFRMRQCFFSIVKHKHHNLLLWYSPCRMNNQNHLEKCSPFVIICFKGDEKHVEQEASFLTRRILTRSYRQRWVLTTIKINTLKPNWLLLVEAHIPLLMYVQFFFSITTSGALPSGRLTVGQITVDDEWLRRFHLMMDPGGGSQLTS